MATLIIHASASSSDVQRTFNTIFGENVIHHFEVESNKLFVHLLDLPNLILSKFIHSLKHNLSKHIEYKEGLFWNVSIFRDFVPRIVDNHLFLQLQDASFIDYLIRNKIYEKFQNEKADRIRFELAGFL